MGDYWPYWFAHYYSGLEFATAVCAFLILISSLDDLFTDAWFWSREAVRAVTVRRRYKPLTVTQLYDRPEQPMAIMVPAWQEHDVIAQMLENMVATLDYANYVVFVGTYVNDPQTIAEVERMKLRYRQLVRVEVPHDGPTCKADCLNWVVQAIVLHEKNAGEPFAGIVLHDSEDILHPVELRFFNYLLPRKDLIQIPVMSLERDWSELVAGTYMDEFAEWHAKDLVVRESISRTVPSAGVGTCFSRRAMLGLAAQTDNQPFNTDSLTEDYDIGARLGAMGMKSVFCRFPVQFEVKRRTWFGYGPIKDKIITAPLCVREFFPDTFRAAYRQKARWTLGIGLQSWSQIGWSGSLAVKYLLFRDRKGIIASFVTAAAYLIAFQLVLFYFLGHMGVLTTRFPSLFAFDPWLRLLLAANGVAFLLRIVQRVYFVNRLYGWEHGILSVPRMIVGNAINFMAAARAWKVFLSNIFLGTPVVWDKTAHSYPSAEALGARRGRLGELLVSWRAIPAEAVDRALAEQRSTEVPLGRLLVSHGLDEETLAEAISFQADLPRVHLTEEQVKAAGDALSIDLCVRWRILPFRHSAHEKVAIAIASPIADEGRAAIEQALGAPPTFFIAREGEIAAGLRLLRGGPRLHDMKAARTVPLLGDILLERRLVGRKALSDALARYLPHRDGLIGDFLVASGIVSRAAVQEALDIQQALRKEAGE